MSWRRSPDLLLAPPAARSGAAAYKLPASAPIPYPALDDHLVTPETTREEVVRGERIIAQPALPEHGDRHFGMDYVVGAHVRAGYVGSTDMLTRLSVGSDFATDTSVRKAGKDPATGQRWLEELAFEIVNEQSFKAMTVRAEDLVTRGVRRVFAVLVKKGEVREWAPETRTWRTLEADAEIDDECLVRPIAVRALLDAAAADDAVARALEAKGNPAIAAMKAASERRAEERGELRALASAVLTVLESRGLTVPERVRARVDGATEIAEVRAFLVRAARVHEADAIFAEP